VTADLLGVVSHEMDVALVISNNNAQILMIKNETRGETGSLFVIFAKECERVISLSPNNKLNTSTSITDQDIVLDDVHCGDVKLTREERERRGEEGKSERV
jgi:hypothetical protein